MPVGPYDTFEECVADNQDKDDPGAFCGWLKEQTSASFGRYDDIDFSPPQGARDEAARGLEWRREHGRGGTEVGIARARDIANGSNLSPETVRRMRNFFTRHQSNKDAEGFSPGEDGYPSNGRIAWALWGGDPGEAWARKVVGQMDARDNATTELEATGRASFEAVDPDDETFDLDVENVEAGVRWEGVLTVENELTGDGRMFTPNAVRWETLPVPLRWVRQDVGEHNGAVVVGRIDEVYRQGNNVMGRGVFDASSPDGLEAARQVREGLTPGVSVDLDDVSFELRVAADVFEMSEEPELDEDGNVVVMRYKPEDEVMVTTDARLRAATIVAVPAFANARLAVVEEGVTLEVDEAEPVIEDEPAPDPEPTDLATLAASAAATLTRPPSRFFDDPKLEEPTPLTVTDDGHVFGHLATWGTCHTGFPGECVEPPSSATDYAYFRTGAVRTAEGEEVAVGRLTLDTTHAHRRLGANDTSAHYEHTGLAVADVAAGEDAYGIWVSGSLRPGVSEDAVRKLMASPLSGDWRRVGGNLELIAALAVNSPGFPIPRVLVAGGSVQSLHSSGVVAAPAPSARHLNEDDRLLDRLLEREREALRRERRDAEAARNRVKAGAAAFRIRRALRS